VFRIEDKLSANGYNKMIHPTGTKMVNSSSHTPVEVIISSGVTCNALGIIRCFGRRGIPVIYLDADKHSLVSYSKYISQKITCPHPEQSEEGYIDTLIDLGAKLDRKPVIIPTGDSQVLALSRYREDLTQFYDIPISSLEITSRFVNKRLFYKTLEEEKILHPKTYFPKDIDELRLMSREIAFPYIIKPAFSALFQKEFGRKCFVIHSIKDSESSIRKLNDKTLDVLLQEIIPGNEIYMFSTYLNRKSEPLAIFGWDKLKQYPPNFGGGCLCQSKWRNTAVQSSIQLLRSAGYHGIAGPEVKKDPRDGQYKLLEINARSVSQNRLPAGCGVDIEYLAYTDITGLSYDEPIRHIDNVMWLDFFPFIATSLIQLTKKDMTMGEIFRPLLAKKIHSIASLADPMPLVAHIVNLTFKIVARSWRTLFSRSRYL
jgi:predicted ATP-grasp superfamily ATP-dependent carboligase